MTALAAEDEDVAAERIGAMICCTLDARPSNPARRSIGWQVRKTLVPGGRPIIRPPQRRPDPPQRLLVDGTVNTHPNPVRQIDLDHPDTLGQGQTRASRAYRAADRRIVPL